MKRKKEDKNNSTVKAIEYVIPFLPPCDSCGRCVDEPRASPVTWDWSTVDDNTQIINERSIKSKPVPIVDARSPNAYKLYQQAISLGEPLVLTGPKMKCLTEFATTWFVNGVFIPEEFCKSVGDAIGPIARDGYTGSQLEEGETMKIAEYMRKYWPIANENERSPYLAQWEFSAAVIDAEEEAREARNGIREDDDDEMGLRSIQWKLSTVPVDVVGSDFFSVNGINPYQYLFIGGAGTTSNVHNDLGGMTIFIGGMVGEKSVTLIHRDDEHLMYGMQARKQGTMSEEDMKIHPLAHLAKSWHHIIVPGDVLVMPPRTIHAVENLTACVSYSRCHFGPHEMGEWLRSYTIFDGPQMNHEIVIHEAANHFLRRCCNQSQLLSNDEVESIRSLRDACRVLAARVNNSDEAAVGAWIALSNELDKILPMALRTELSKSNIEFQAGGVVVESLSSKASSIVTGDIVSLLPGVAQGKRCGRRAVVVEVQKNILLARVKYLEFPGTELIPVKRLRTIPDKKLGTPPLAKGVKVVVSWPVTGESFNATIVDYSSNTPLDALELQFHRLGAEWNQWVTVSDVAHVTNGFKIEL